jgi:hypothetical protein
MAIAETKSFSEREVKIFPLWITKSTLEASLLFDSFSRLEIGRNKRNKLRRQRVRTIRLLMILDLLNIQV